MSQRTIPGLLRPLEDYRGWKKPGDRKTIEAKRQAVIRGIERHLKGEKGASSLEYLDPAQGGPVIRVLYASHTLPIFDGKPHALIDPACDRQALWGRVIEEIRGGSYDREIEAVAKKVAASLEKKRAALKAA